MFKCVKTHNSRVHDLVGSTNRERRGVTVADMYTMITVMVSGLSVIIRSHVVYVMPCMCGGMSS